MSSQTDVPARPPHDAPKNEAPGQEVRRPHRLRRLLGGDAFKLRAPPGAPDPCEPGGAWLERCDGRQALEAQSFVVDYLTVRRQADLALRRPATRRLLLWWRQTGRNTPDR